MIQYSVNVLNAELRCLKVVIWLRAILYYIKIMYNLKCQMKSKWRKKKANDWMWQSQRKPQLMIVKRPQTKDKKILYWYF